MKNKYTILLIILSFIASSTYIITKTYNNSDSFSIQASKIDNNFYENLYIKEETTHKEIETENTTVNKNVNNIQNNSLLININTADKETLKMLPSIGDTIAQNIIDYRENVSLFYNIEDIKNVNRIGDKTYEKIKNLITIN